jgi:hypothetical protein
MPRTGGPEGPTLRQIELRGPAGNHWFSAAAANSWKKNWGLRQTIALNSRAQGARRRHAQANALPPDERLPSATDSFHRRSKLGPNRIGLSAPRPCALEGSFASRRLWHGSATMGDDQGIEDISCLMRAGNLPMHHSESSARKTLAGETRTSLSVHGSATAKNSFAGKELKVTARSFFAPGICASVHRAAPATGQTGLIVCTGGKPREYRDKPQSLGSPSVGIR